MAVTSDVKSFDSVMMTRVHCLENAGFRFRINSRVFTLIDITAS